MAEKVVKFDKISSHIIEINEIIKDVKFEP